jgi:hypothetical protein
VEISLTSSKNTVFPLCITMLLKDPEPETKALISKDFAKLISTHISIISKKHPNCKSYFHARRGESESGS